MPGAPCEHPHVVHVREAVLARQAVDEREAVSIERFLAELDRLDDPLREDASPVHVTASAIVVGERGVVLLRHKRLGIWVQPGGHIEPGEAPWDAAVREATEETGLALGHAGDAPAVVHVDVHEGGRGHTHLDLRYLLVGPLDDPAPPPDESPEVRWMAWAEAIDLADAGLEGALRALRP